jgi:hypothetical protein
MLHFLGELLFGTAFRKNPKTFQLSRMTQPVANETTIKKCA